MFDVFRCVGAVAAVRVVAAVYAMEAFVEWGMSCAELCQHADLSAVEAVDGLNVVRGRERWVNFSHSLVPCRPSPPCLCVQLREFVDELFRC